MVQIAKAVKDRIRRKNVNRNKMIAMIERLSQHKKNYNDRICLSNYLHPD